MIIAFREKGWFDKRTDYRMWDHLCRAFGQEFQMVSEWSEATAKGPIVVLEQTGDTNLEKFIHPSICTYVFGRTGLNNLSKQIPYATPVKIATENPISLFGVEAAAIVLYDRALKWQHQP